MTYLYPQGVSECLERLQRRLESLSQLCTAHKEESLRQTQIYNDFLEKYNAVSRPGQRRSAARRACYALLCSWALRCHLLCLLDIVSVKSPTQCRVSFLYLFLFYVVLVGILLLNNGVDFVDAAMQKKKYLPVIISMVPALAPIRLLLFLPAIWSFTATRESNPDMSSRDNSTVTDHDTVLLQLFLVSRSVSPSVIDTATPVFCRE